MEPCRSYEDSRTHQIDILAAMMMFTFVALMIVFDNIFFGFGALLSLITGRIAVEKIRPYCTCSGQKPH